MWPLAVNESPIVTNCLPGFVESPRAPTVLRLELELELPFSEDKLEPELEASADGDAAAVPGVAVKQNAAVASALSATESGLFFITKNSLVVDSQRIAGKCWRAPSPYSGAFPHPEPSPPRFLRKRDWPISDS